MSLIIAAKIGDRVVMMGDSAESVGPFVESLTERERLKVLRVGDALVGSAGKVQSIRHLVENPEWFDTKGEPFDKKFIVTHIVPELFDELDKYGVLGKDDDDIPCNRATSVIAHRDRIFFLANNLSVYEVDKFVAVGCTRELVFPLLRDMKEGEELATMLEAMRLSSELSSAVRPPYYYVDSATYEFTTVEE